jgi:luciferase-like monooxygenase
MQLGIDSFAAAFDENSRAVDPAARMRHLVEQIEHADEVGLDVFGVGEHHRREFLDSAPAAILGAAAVRTERIRLTSAVTVLSAEDPVRAFQNFASRTRPSSASALRDFHVRWRLRPHRCRHQCQAPKTTGVPGVREDWRDLGAPAHVPGVRRDALLRRFALTATRQSTPARPVTP